MKIGDINYFIEDTFMWKGRELSEYDKKVIIAIKILYPKYIWIARDRNNKLYVYRAEPVKRPEYWEGFRCVFIDEEFLQFIQWEDKEPYYIGD